MSRHMYFSLDSDALSNLAEFSKFMESNPEAIDEEIIEVFNTSKNGSVVKNLETYRKLFNIAKDKDSLMRFLVTTTPWEESNHIATVRQFVNKYCYVPKVKYLLQNKCQERIEKLARAYCKKYRNKKGTECPPPMKATYKAIGRAGLTPENDAVAMSEASYFGACMLTENSTDYIHMDVEYVKDPKTGRYYTNGDNKRRAGIIEINNSFGLIQSLGDGHTIVPKPWAVDHIGKFLDNLEDFRTYMSEDDNFEKAEIEM